METSDWVNSPIREGVIVLRCPETSQAVIICYNEDMGSQYIVFAGHSNYSHFRSVIFREPKRSSMATLTGQLTPQLQGDPKNR